MVKFEYSKIQISPVSHIFSYLHMPKGLVVGVYWWDKANSIYMPKGLVVGVYWWDKANKCYMQPGSTPLL